MGDGRPGQGSPEGAARDALDALVAKAYPELRALAAAALRGERASTLQPTVLAHEIYLRLAQLTRIEWHGTRHLLAVASRLARRVLVDEARRRGRQKRDGRRVTLTLERLAAPGTDHDVLVVDEVLHELEAIDGTAASVVELRVFGGLSVEECAAELSLSASTVHRKWRAGRTWLVRELAA